MFSVDICVLEPNIREINGSAVIKCSVILFDWYEKVRLLQL